MPTGRPARLARRSAKGADMTQTIFHRRGVASPRRLTTRRINAICIRFSSVFTGLIRYLSVSSPLPRHPSPHKSRSINRLRSESSLTPGSATFSPPWARILPPGACISGNRARLCSACTYESQTGEKCNKCYTRENALCPGSPTRKPSHQQIRPKMVAIVRIGL